MTNYTRIAGLVIAAVTLTTTPALAQRNRRDDGGGDRRERRATCRPAIARISAARARESFHAAIGRRIGATTSFPAGPMSTTIGPTRIGRRTDTAPTATGPAGAWAFTSARRIPRMAIRATGMGRRQATGTTRSFPAAPTAPSASSTRRATRRCWSMGITPGWWTTTTACSSTSIWKPAHTGSRSRFPAARQSPSTSASGPARR